MKISVVIPVYNAQKFVHKAVESALQQRETGEVLLIEDGSFDSSLQVCMELEHENRRVKLFRHPGGENRGAGATRNLGIRKAAYDLIAFLDADDYYLPERFSRALEVLRENDKIDGVHEAVAMQFYDQASRERWLSDGRAIFAGVDERVNPETLFESLAEGKNGFIHLDGLLVKKKLFAICGHFPEHLKLHQDTAAILQLAAFGKLAPGKYDTPVAIRVIHADNRITKNANPIQTKALMWETLFEWALQKRLNLRRLILVYKRHIETSYRLLGQTGRAQASRALEARHIYRKFREHPILFIGAALSYSRQTDYRSP